jgi:hypothetical protein
LASVFSVATFLPMSRSGVVILIFICGSVLWSYGVTRIKTVVIGMLIGAAMLAFIPRSVLQRLSFTTERDEFGRLEGRAQIYTAFFHHLPEFVTTGVGVGNFKSYWGPRSMFNAGARGATSRAHNVFFQMMIYWGIPGLLGLLAIVWQGYWCLPGGYKNDGLAIGILCVAVSSLLLGFVVHTFYAKEFSIGIGLVAGTHRWIWSKRPQFYMRRPRTAA